MECAFLLIPLLRKTSLGDTLPAELVSRRLELNPLTHLLPIRVDAPSTGSLPTGAHEFLSFALVEDLSLLSKWLANLSATGARVGIFVHIDEAQPILSNEEKLRNLQRLVQALYAWSLGQTRVVCVLVTGLACGLVRVPASSGSRPHPARVLQLHVLTAAEACGELEHVFNNELSPKLEAPFKLSPTARKLVSLFAGPPRLLLLLLAACDAQLADQRNTSVTVLSRCVSLPRLARLLQGDVTSRSVKDIVQLARDMYPSARLSNYINALKTLGPAAALHLLGLLAMGEAVEPSQPLGASDSIVDDIVASGFAIAKPESSTSSRVVLMWPPFFAFLFIKPHMASMPLPESSGTPSRPDAAFDWAVAEVLDLRVLLMRIFLGGHLQTSLPTLSVSRGRDSLEAPGSILLSSLQSSLVHAPRPVAVSRLACERAEPVGARPPCAAPCLEPSVLP